MITPFTYHGECCQIEDNISLVQALERCAAAYLNCCLHNVYAEYPDLMWLRLYSAAERLKQAVRQNTVAPAILEIGFDLMGCSEMAILQPHGTSILSLLAGSEMTAEHEQALAVNARAIASAIKARHISIVNADTPYNKLWLELGITAFVPVWREGVARGAIIFYRLLTQRNDLDLADRELLRLLSMFAGPALFNR